MLYTAIIIAAGQALFWFVASFISWRWDTITVLAEMNLGDRAGLLLISVLVLVISLWFGAILRYGQ